MPNKNPTRLPQPPWIHCSLLNNAIMDGDHDFLKAHDPNLSQVVVDANPTKRARLCHSSTVHADDGDSDCTALFQLGAHAVFALLRRISVAILALCASTIVRMNRAAIKYRRITECLVPLIFQTDKS